MTAKVGYITLNKYMYSSTMREDMFLHCTTLRAHRCSHSDKYRILGYLGVVIFSSLMLRWLQFYFGRFNFRHLSWRGEI